MTDQKRRVAILLRGPQCTGKTTTARALLAGEEPIGLDNRKYDQLRANEDVLVIELGYGERAGLSPGPTRDPAKWQGVLADEERTLYLISAPFPVRAGAAVCASQSRAAENAAAC
jgi:hypothetical protein